MHFAPHGLSAHASAHACPVRRLAFGVWRPWSAVDCTSTRLQPQYLLFVIDTEIDGTRDLGNAGPATDDGLFSWSAHVQDWREGDPTWGDDARGKGLIGAINYVRVQSLHAAASMSSWLTGLQATAAQRDRVPAEWIPGHACAVCVRWDVVRLILAGAPRVPKAVHGLTRSAADRSLRHILPLAFRALACAAFGKRDERLLTADLYGCSQGRTLHTMPPLRPHPPWTHPAISRSKVRVHPNVQLQRWLAYVAF